MKKFVLLLTTALLTAGSVQVPKELTGNKEAMMKKLIESNNAYFKQGHIQKELERQKKYIRDSRERNKDAVAFRTKKDDLIRKGLLLQESVLKDGDVKKGIALGKLVLCVYDASTMGMIDRCKEQYRKR